MLPIVKGDPIGDPNERLREAEEVRVRNVATVRNVAAKFVERAEALKYKGKKRDDAALDFFCGAATMAQANGQTMLAQHLTNVIVMVISVRGYVGVQQLLREKEESDG